MDYYFLAESDNPEIAIVLLFLFGGILVYAGFQGAKQRMLMRDTPTSKIRSMAMGTVEIKGKAVPAGKTFTTPLTLNECVGYRYKIEEWREGSGKDDTGEWRTVKDETVVTPFYVDDSTGKVVVDAERTEINLKNSTKIRSDKINKSIFEKLWAWIKSVFGKTPKERYKNIPEETLNRLENESRKRRHTEYYIGIGESVYVFGEAMRVENAEWADSEEEAEKEEHSPRIRDVFEKVAEMAEGKSSVSDFLREQDVIISKRESTPMFMVSDKSEKKISRDKFWGSMLAILLGVGLLVGGFAVTLNTVGVL